MSTISIRPTTTSDLDVLFEFQRDPEGMFLAAFTPVNADYKTAYLEKYTSLLNTPTVFMQTIIYDSEIVGSVSTFVMEGDTDITYGIDRQHWGKGIVSEAVKQFLKIENRRPIYGRTAFDNFGSQRVLEKNGFMKIGTDRGFANARHAEIEEFIFRLD